MVAFNCGGPDNQGGTHWDACDCVATRTFRLELLAAEVRKVQAALAAEGDTDLGPVFAALADLDKPFGEYKPVSYIGPNAYTPVVQLGTPDRCSAYRHSFVVGMDHCYCGAWPGVAKPVGA